MKINILFLLMSLAAGLTSAEQWRDNSAASNLYFAPSFEGLPINGEFRQFSVNISSDPNLQPESLIVLVQIASADLGSSDLNEAIQMVDWFDSQGFAEARFSSDQIVATDQDNQFVASGRLSLKAAEKTIESISPPYVLWRTPARLAGVAVVGYVLVRLCARCRHAAARSSQHAGSCVDTTLTLRGTAAAPVTRGNSTFQHSLASEVRVKRS